MFFAIAAPNISGKVQQGDFLLFFQIHFIAYFHVCKLWLLPFENFYAVRFTTICFHKAVSFHKQLNWKVLCKLQFCNASNSSKLIGYNKVSQLHSTRSQNRKGDKPRSVKFLQ